MKKMISLLAVMLLLCSALALSVNAAAGTQDDPIVCTGLNFNMVKIPAGETHFVTFTDTNAAAKRLLNINSTTDKDAGYTVTIGDTVQDADVDGYCNIVVTPDANNTYTFSITNKSTNQATFFINFYDVSPYEISDTILYVGENAVTTMMADTTLYIFEAEETGIYEVLVDQANATLSHWNGSAAFVSGLAKETTDGKLEVTCAALGQTLLIGLSNVDSANLIITKVGEYVAPESVVYEDYTNKHTPIADFKLPEGIMTTVDITVAQTVVLGADGIYRYGSANGPVLYVDMTGTAYADLYECFYPAAGEAADRLRGTYTDEDGKTCGYEFLNAMRAYANALDAEGYYYLTEDLANYLQMYGKDQGWYNAVYSPFDLIKAGDFNADSAWLINACYDPNTANVDPVLPDQPAEPETPADPEQPDSPIGGEDESESPATGDVASFGAMAALLISATGALTFCKKRK